MDEDNQQGFSVGVAPAGSRPTLLEEFEEDEEGEPSPSKEKKKKKKDDEDTKQPEKGRVFLDWKKKSGTQFEAKFSDLKNQVLAKKNQAKEMVRTLNQKKQIIEKI